MGTEYLPFKFKVFAPREAAPKEPRSEVLGISELDADCKLVGFKVNDVMRKLTGILGRKSVFCT
jgi:hypothetical protein